MNAEKKVFLNTFYQMAGKMITSFLGVINFGFLARYLGPVRMGEYNLILSFVGFLFVFADFGLGTILTREVAGKKADKDYIDFVFSLRFLLTLAMAVFSSFLIFFFNYSTDVKLGVIIFAFGNIAYMLSQIIWSIFQAKMQFGKIVVTQVFISVISCLLVLTSVLLKMPLLFFICIASFTIIISFIITLKLYGENLRFLFNLLYFKKIAKESWSLGVGAVVSVIYFKIDSLIIPLFYNPSIHADLGYYSTAYKIFEVAMVFGGFYTQTLFPLFSANLHTANFRKHFFRFFVYTVLLALAGNISLLLFAKIFITILGGSKYLPAVTSLQILSFAVSSCILSGFFLDIGIAAGKQLVLVKCAIAASIINIILNILVIPKYSYIGASWTTVVTQYFILISYAVVAFYVIRRLNKQKKELII